MEDELAGGGAGNGVDALGDLAFLELRLADAGDVDYGVKYAFDLLGSDAGNGLGLGDQAFLDMSTAILKAAAGRRFPVRHCSM